jgi:hypothetical protein
MLQKISPISKKKGNKKNMRDGSKMYREFDSLNSEENDKWDFIELLIKRKIGDREIIIQSEFDDDWRLIIKYSDEEQSVNMFDSLKNAIDCANIICKDEEQETERFK